MEDNNYLKNLEKYFLKPGYIYVTKIPTVISTILGSCIGICMYDSIKKYGGMNHYLFPGSGKITEANAKYGTVSIYALIKTFLDMGSNKKDLCASVIGGAHLKNIKDSIMIAEENIKIYKKILNYYSIKIIKETVRGTFGRKIDFFTEINEIKIININNIDIKYFNITGYED